MFAKVAIWVVKVVIQAVRDVMYVRVVIQAVKGVTLARLKTLVARAILVIVAMVVVM